MYMGLYINSSFTKYVEMCAEVVVASESLSQMDPNIVY